MPLHHVWGNSTCIDIGIVDARAVRHMFTQVIDAHVHQLRRVQRRPAQMRRTSGMSRTTGEGEINPRICQRTASHHGWQSMRVPGNGDIHILKRAFTHHECLCCAALFRRAAIIPHTPRRTSGSQPIPYSHSGQHRGGPQQVVTTTMPVAAQFHGGLHGHIGLLAQPCQSIEFTKKGDHWPAFPRFAHHRGGNVSNSVLHPEALMRQLFQMRGSGPGFRITGFRRGPDPVGQGAKPLLGRFDK